MNLLPEVAAGLDMFLITCEYTPDVVRRIGWTPSQEVCPRYRDKLVDLCQLGIAPSDITSVYEEFSKRKQDHDLT